MSDAQALLSEIHQARLDRLKEICAQHGLSRNGSVEFLRARLIADLILKDWDLSPEGISKIINNELGEVLAVFGIKKSGSIRERRQRLYLHLNHDAKQLVPEKLDTLSREKLHELCVKLDLPRSGSKQILTMRVAGVLMSQLGSWGQIKKSLRRPRGKVKAISIPNPLEDDEQSIVHEELPVNEEIIEAPPAEEITENNDVEIIEVIQAPVIAEPEHQEITEELLAIEKRQAEVDALCRDFLLVGSINDSEDVTAFINSLSTHGLMAKDESSISFVRKRLNALDSRSRQEKDAMHSLPGSWREKEALRSFEDARTILRDSLPEIILENPGDQVKARMTFEEKARELGLDLRLPSISGRLHALFDLQISLDDEIAASDPRTARRTRVTRVLQHGAVHLQPSERRTLDRLERNLSGFEQLCEAIFDKSEGNYDDAQQALVVRFLEKKGYEVNTSEIRPRVVAAAGIIGAELGYITPGEIPRLAPGIKVSDTEIDSIITDLKRLAQQFKPGNVEDSADIDLEVAESVADAADRVSKARNKLDGVDDLLARLRISR
ncbi:MAG: hypothetical protein QGI21_00515 [Candidatus Poseidoniaceae archaeon]|jgi:hypothetical protein|nr:hypothetical protein [Candidatus Poseidoniaceae archaeon]